jgi:Ca2+-binding RTX toxin-like protein
MATLIGGDDNETLTGTSGADLIKGFGGDDELVGGDGDDTLAGGAGNDIISGEGGTNTIVYSGDYADYIIDWDLHQFTITDTVADRDGVDTVTGAWYFEFADQTVAWTTFQGADITGTSGDDTLVGTSLPEIIQGAGGNDSLTGGDGHDSITAGSGNDTIDGGAGDDEIYSGAGNDSLFGGAGNDVIYTQSGNDTVDGGAGVDQVGFDLDPGTSGVTVNLLTGTAFGSNWSDRLTRIENVSGTSYADSLTGNFGGNVLSSGDGNDTLAGNGGDDDLDGGAGTDLAIFVGAHADYWIGYDAVTKTYWLVDTVPDRNGISRVTGVESFEFSDGTKTAANLGAVAMVGGTTANDLLTGDTGNDSLSGLAGNDTLDGSGGDDTLSGGEGADGASYAFAGGSVAVNLTSGTATGASGNDVLTGIENVIGGHYADTITGDAGANLLEGREGNDTLKGGGGDDLIFGGLGVDTAVYAGKRADYWVGYDAARDMYVVVDSTSDRDGADLVDNVDSFKFSDTTKSVTALQAIAVTVGTAEGEMLQGTTAGEAIRGLGGDDTVDGGAGDDALYGDSGTDTLSYSSASGTVIVNLLAGTATGSAGNDLLNGFENVAGSAFADSITGDGGANRIDGGAGNDSIVGGEGDDTLSGGAGNDTIDGGEGNDTVVYHSARSQYSVGATAGSHTVTHISGSDGLDTLTGVERVSFLDGGIAFDLDGNAGIAARVIGAVITPSFVGNKTVAGIALGLLDHGETYAGLVEVALEAMLGTTRSNVAVVELLLTNLIGSVPSDAVRDHFVDLLDQGVYTQVSLAMLAADQDLNAINIGLTGLASSGLEYV